MRALLLVLARGNDRGGLDEDDVDLFNLKLNEVLLEMQHDPEITVRYAVELLLALDRAIGRLTIRSRRSNQAVVYHLLSG